MIRAASLAIAAAAALAGPVLAAPTSVTITPPDGARFLAGQRFDLRVEGKGTGPFSATLTLDGALLTFTSGAQNTAATDGISKPGWGGFNLRGFASLKPGTHRLEASFTDSTSTEPTKVSSAFQIVGVGRGDEERGRRAIKNVILLIGDGMGIAHRTAGRLVKFGATAGQPNGWLAMEKLPGTGLITTHSLNSIVTDSAPGMACYASGSHTNNGQEGVYPANVTNPFFQPRIEYMAEYLHRVKGTSLGLVTTADVEDATPAANAVHTGNRGAGQGIVDQYLDEADWRDTRAYGTGLKVLMGGGRRWFLPKGKFGSSRDTSNDYPALPDDLRTAWGLPASAAGAIDPTRDLIADFEGAGFAYADTASSLSFRLAQNTPGKLLGLFGYGNMNVALDKIAKRRSPEVHGVVDDYHAPDQPMLDEMTEAALRVLARNRNGFVLMVEGAHIDKQSHLMDAERVIDEVLELDNAVAVARKFADSHRDTLILVTADHECSGFSLIGALAGGVENLRSLPPDNGTTDPSRAPKRQDPGVVGVYEAAGFPRYQILADGYPASLDIDGKILVGYGADGDRYETWLTKPTPVIDSLLPNGIKAELRDGGYAGEPVDRSERSSGFFIRGQAFGKGQAVHTASDVPVASYSSGGNRAWQDFVGVQTNTDVFFKVMRAVLRAGED